MDNEQCIKYNGNRTKVLSCDPKASGSVVLDDSVTTICECAFQDCKLVEWLKFIHNYLIITYKVTKNLPFGQIFKALILLKTSALG